MTRNTLLWYCSDNGGLRRLGSTGGRAVKGSIYDGGLLVPAFLEWPARLSKPQATSIRCNTCDIYPTLMEIAAAPLPVGLPLDGISLVPLIEGRQEQRQRPMGFWAFPKGGRGVSSVRLMNALLEAQRSGGDLDPNEGSLQAAVLPEVKYRVDDFPGHAAWLSGDWKLHRIAKPSREEQWELYNLERDPMEEQNLADSEQERVAAMRGALESWQESVLRSLNGEDYGG